MEITKSGYIYSVEDTVDTTTINGELTDYVDGQPVIILKAMSQDNEEVARSRYMQDPATGEYIFNISSSVASNIGLLANKLLQMSQVAIDSLDENNNENNE
jgi:hypothetical protein